MRNCECIGIPSMFQGRVMGVGDVSFEKELSLIKEYFPTGTRAAVCHPDSPAGTCKPVDWVAIVQEQTLESKRQIKDAQKWRSNTPIASWTATNPSGGVRTINVYGYNKEIGYVWIAEGPHSSAANSQLFPEIVLASKSPEWVASKSSLGKSSGGGSATLPLILGAVYLLLS